MNRAESSGPPEYAASAYGVAGTPEVEFDVALVSTANRLQTAQVFRQRFLWSLKEALEAVKGPLPYTLVRGVGRFEAEDLLDALKVVGAVVEIRTNAPPSAPTLYQVVEGVLAENPEQAKTYLAGHAAMDDLIRKAYSVAGSSGFSPEELFKAFKTILLAP